MGTREEEARFRTVVEAYQEKVRNTCFRYLHNPEDADDVAQEVFVEAYESLDHFREESRLSTWIYRIAVNKCIDFIRRKNRKKRFAQLISIFGVGRHTTDIPDPGGRDPHADLEIRERNATLNQVLDSLPDNQKTAILLSTYEGLSNKELASVMSLSLTAAEALLHRAKSNLKKQLTRYFERSLK